MVVVWGAMCACARMSAQVGGVDSGAGAPLKFEVTIAPGAGGSETLTGHLDLLISKKPASDDEPRNLYDESYTSQQAFGVDVVKLAPGGVIVVDAAAVGYPRASLRDIDAGDYTVQAVFNKYEEFHPASGGDLWLAPEMGEGQHWNKKPGNPMSAPVKMHLDGKNGGTAKLVLDAMIPALPPQEPDTKLLKHVQIKSEMLSRFWGRDVYVGAIVLLPEGWAEHASAKYPVVVWEDHFHENFRAPMPWREQPAPADAKGVAKIVDGYAYKFYDDWTNGTMPHVILVMLNHANPYYDDSYAVNSANIGPYGDAITQEIIPELERRYRGIGQGWARATQQILYPDFWNGAWGYCPDPVDFHAYQAANLYDEPNAYVRTADFGTVPVPSDRSSDAVMTATMEQVNQFEYVLGTHGRSAEQYDAWQAVFSPVGADGYPKPIYDKRTGVIDKSVAEYWKEHYDLDAILMRDWKTLGPKLEGKLHIAVGDSDTYFLNNAVHLLQDNLEKTTGPHSDAEFDFGPRKPHCYTGKLPDWDESRGTDLEQRVIPLMVKHMLATAPAGADVTSWRY
jgi:hypothetical protein